MTRCSLVIIHRGPEYRRDFDEIAVKVRALDPAVEVYHCAASEAAGIPARAWRHPALTIALLAQFRVPVPRGRIFKNQSIQKLIQQKMLRDKGIPTPPALPFAFGMKLDPVLFGAFVILKPVNLRQTSRGDGIRVMRRKRAEQLLPSDFPRLGLLPGNLSAYIVQKFNSTGEYPTSFRITTFLGAVITSEKIVSKIASPPLSSADEVIESASFISKGQRDLLLVKDDDVLDLAVRAAKCFPSIPLLGIDIIRDVNNRLQVLEVNAGGNTWHYSSKATEENRRRDPGYYAGMKTQFGAFDIVARRMCEEVRWQAL